MKGDLLFHRGGTSLSDRIILATTQPGPYVHVGMDWGDGLELSAETVGGVRVRQIDPAVLAGSVTRYALARACQPDHLALAVSWASKQVHARYGVADVASQLARLLRWPFYVAWRHTYDCSDLAACFAALALQQDDLWCWVLDNRQQISPNDLAHYFHL